MDPNSNNNNINANANNNRIHLNFGFNDRSFSPANNRAYPTTPSAFPQPIYQSPGTHDYFDTQSGPYGQGYFVNGGAYTQQPQYAPQFGQQNLQSPQPAYHLGYNANDGTTGLVQQFSNQDLNSNRANIYARSASPGQRPRATGPPAAPQPYAGHLAPTGSRIAKTQPEEDLQRNPERFSDNVHKRGKAAKELVNVFFHENIERARDRNMR